MNKFLKKRSPLSTYKLKSINLEDEVAETEEQVTEEFNEDEFNPFNSNISFPDPQLLKYYRDVDQRIIWLLQDIDQSSYSIVEQIIQYNEEDKDLPIEERTPIRIIIDSSGGLVQMTFVIADIIKMSKTPVYGYAFGACCSGASIIYLSCHRRFALPNANFLFHKGSCGGITGTYDQVQAFMSHYKIQVDRIVEFYEKHTKYSKELIQEKLTGSSDWYILADEAIEYNVVDEIVTDIDQILLPKI